MCIRVWNNWGGGGGRGLWQFKPAQVESQVMGGFLWTRFLFYLFTYLFLLTYYKLIKNLQKLNVWVLFCVFRWFVKFPYNLSPPPPPICTMGRRDGLWHTQAVAVSVHLSYHHNHRLPNQTNHLPNPTNQFRWKIEKLYNENSKIFNVQQQVVRIHKSVIYINCEHDQTGGKIKPDF